jgi:hypothetical protein
MLDAITTGRQLPTHLAAETREEAMSGLGLLLAAAMAASAPVAAQPQLAMLASLEGCASDVAGRHADAHGRAIGRGRSPRNRDGIARRIRLENRRDISDHVVTIAKIIENEEICDLRSSTRGVIIDIIFLFWAPQYFPILQPMQQAL